MTRNVLLVRFYCCSSDECYFHEVLLVYFHFCLRVIKYNILLLLLAVSLHGLENLKVIVINCGAQAYPLTSQTVAEFSFRTLQSKISHGGDITVSSGTCLR